MVFSTPHEKKKREILKKNQATGKVCLTFRGHYSYIVDLGERGTSHIKKMFPNTLPSSKTFAIVAVIVVVVVVVLILVSPIAIF